MSAGRGVCFDFNGVIVDDERHHCAALIATLADAVITLAPASYYRDYLGYDDRGCFHHAFAAAGRQLTADRLDALIDAKGDRYRALIEADLTLIPGAAAFIHALHHAGISLVVVSAARRWEIEHVLAVAGLREAFRGLISAEDVERTKPDPEGYRKGLRLLGLPARSCVVVEDSLPGLAAGRAAGMRVAMVATSHSAAELSPGAPDALWDHFVNRTIEDLPWLDS